jgi:starvation-inducible DNA-binding protein
MLADSYTLYLMTHNFHWNVTGPLFNTLHAMFMEQYTEQWQALDSIAERIRALGLYAPGTYGEYAKLSSISEPTNVPDAESMIQLLLKGNEAVAKTARTALEKADDVDDPAPGRAREKRLDAAQSFAVAICAGWPETGIAFEAWNRAQARFSFGCPPLEKTLIIHVRKYLSVYAWLRTFRRLYEIPFYSHCHGSRLYRRHAGIRRSVCRHDQDCDRRPIHRPGHAIRRHGQAGG